MAVKFLIFLFIFTVSLLGVQSKVRGLKNNKVVVCHFVGVEREEYYNFKVEDAELSLCTHLVYGYAEISEYNSKFTVGDKVSRLTLEAVRKKYPYIKISLAFGLLPEKGGIPVAKNNRDELINNLVSAVSDYDFDGLDLLIFGYPRTRDATDNLLTLVQELKDEFETYAFMLTATFLSFDKLFDKTNYLVQLSNYLDLIHFSTVNFLVSGRQQSLMFAPLKGENDSDTTSVELLIKHLLSHGMKPAKLVPMILLVALNFQLSDNYIENIPFEDFADANNFRAFHRFNDICWEQTAGMKSRGYGWFDKYSIAYIRNDSYITLLDNPRSIANKVKLAMDYDLKGLSVWNFHHDDVMGRCKFSKDTYLEFNESYNKLKEEPNLSQRLNALNLTKVDAASQLRRNDLSYAILDDRLYFRAPELKSGPYPILRTINQAIALSLEEKRILNALKKKPVRRTCLFWPICAAPLKPETNS